MKRVLTKLLFIIVVIIIILLILNINVTTRQGINYQWHTIKLPLYLKILDFFDRHYNSKQLVRTIIKDAPTQQEKVMQIFNWVHQNIKKAPEGLPIVDDHVWHIIIRRYGVDDQFQDVFTTLCNYAKVNAFFIEVGSEKGRKNKPLSFIKLKRGWSVFDAYYGVYFKNRRGETANIEDLLSSDWQAFSISNKEIPNYYPEYFNNLQTVNYTSWKFSRPATQSPISRFICWIKGR